MNTTTHPDAVGRYVVHGQSHFFAIKRSEIERCGLAAARVIATFELLPGRFVLTISLMPEIAQIGPFESGVQLLGLLGTNADLSPYEATRVEALVRLFDVAAICGIDKSVLDGLAMIGKNAAEIFKGRIVWARPDAYALVAAMPGVIARRCVELGPVLGLECAAGEGMHIDGREWDISDAGGTIRLSSRAYRIQPVTDLDTGVKGHVVGLPCSCGNRDPLVVLD